MGQRRLALVVGALAAATAALALWSRRDGGVAASASPAPASPVPLAPPMPVALNDDTAPLAQRSEAAAAHALEELEAGATEIVEHAAPRGEAHVEVRVLVPGETTPLAPHPYAGGVVLTQSWDEPTRDTNSHSASIDADGVARFHFPSSVHLDWFRAEPPAAARADVGFLEVHENVPAGGLYRVAIECQPGARIVGRVATTSGAPLVGVEVSAFVEGDGVRDEWTDEWYPGHFTTQSGAGGGFCFPALPPGSLTVSVRPGEWLQVSPDYYGRSSDRTSLELEAGESFDVGELLLARRATIDARIVDAGGRAVAHTSVEFVPLRFADPHLSHPSDWERRLSQDAVREDRGADLTDEQVAEWIEAAERELETAPIWPEESSERSTDADGRVRAHLVEGLWELRILPRLAAAEHEVRRQARLPAEGVVITLDAHLRSVRGVVRSEGNATPVADASLSISTGNESVHVSTDRTGRFSFESLLLRQRARLRASAFGHFSIERELRIDEDELTIELTPAAQLVLVFRDTQGKAVRRGLVRVRPLELEPAARADVRAVEWMASASAQPPSTRLDRGATRFSELWPGSYEVTLVMAGDLGERGAWGEVVLGQVEAHRSVARTSEPMSMITVDLTRFPPVEATEMSSVMLALIDEASGASVSHAVVEVTHPLATRTFVQPQDRELSFEVPSGEIALTIRHPDFQTLHVPPTAIDRRGWRARLALQRLDAGARPADGR